MWTAIITCTPFAGSLFVAQAFLRHASPNATVVEINSSAAHVNFSPGFSAYSVGKLAVCRLWDSLAFANPEMSVFHLQPGIVDTAMNREAGGIDAIGFSDDGELNKARLGWIVLTSLCSFTSCELYRLACKP